MNNHSWTFLSFLVLFFVTFGLLYFCYAQVTHPNRNDDINIHKFPSDFVFGTATAAYQIEGAYLEDGRKLSIWDTFSHTPNKTKDGDTGDVACDHYHRVKQDIGLMKSLGFKYYRMSLSWPRILPNGFRNNEGDVNQKAIDHYNQEINALIDAGIQVFITLYHWDLPQALEDGYRGWLNKSAMVKAFTEYADVCFEAFGDRVKHWITLNEPYVVAQLGYGDGVNAPGRCTGCKPAGGNSSTEPYIVAHSLLNAHASAVHLYREKYLRKQKGFIGITFNSDYNLAMDPNSERDREAAERIQLFQLGWFADPVYFGDYPQVMKERVGDRLPKFTKEEIQLLRGSSDFFGLNHYTSRYIGYLPDTARDELSNMEQNWYTDVHVNISIYSKDGKIIGPRAASEWLYVYPPGIQGILKWISSRYNYPSIYVTENGCDDEGDIPIDKALNDQFRIDYLKEYLSYAYKAMIEDEVKLKGYFVWSLMDNFEWGMGYSKRFGIHYVNYKTQERFAKKSAKWLEDFMKPKLERK